MTSLQLKLLQSRLERPAPVYYTLPTNDALVALAALRARKEAK